jgi:hypothetical protein
MSSDAYYLAGTDGSSSPILLKVDPTTDGVTTLLPKNSQYYDIYAMSVSSANTVNFNALRMSDGAKIIGQIDASGSLTILDSTLNTQVVMLEKIN